MSIVRIIKGGYSRAFNLSVSMGIMFLSGLFGRDHFKLAAHKAYVAIVEQARDQRFFNDLGVPDTLDGRFETISLHVFLVLHRLKSEPQAQRFSQRLFDTVFADMDRNLREMGNGDLSVGKQVKRMATAFYGRVAVYEAGLMGNGDLEGALRRNLFGTVPDPDPAAIAWFAAYLKHQAAWFAKMDSARMIEGMISFDVVSFVIEEPERDH